MSGLAGKTVVLYLENMYNDLEFWYPRLRLVEAGAKVLVAAPEAGREYKSKFGMPAVADAAFRDLDPASLHGVIIPGGYAPDLMRRHQAALTFVRAMFDAGKLVAAICHAGWVPVSAGILRGKRCTSFFSIKDDMVNAGALWEDAAAVVDGCLVSSRTPDDLPQFMTACLGVLRG
ncbi:MAG: protease [Deltaproteobacteria bacterium HGW-Deltaproteobacteria-8]|nr:MAG: protease [Deltaproteobacteria bacterium HGW-Deltaproteobacteria-8]